MPYFGFLKIIRLFYLLRCSPQVHYEETAVGAHIDKAGHVNLHMLNSMLTSNSS